MVGMEKWNVLHDHDEEHDFIAHPDTCIGELVMVFVPTPLPFLYIFLLTWSLYSFFFSNGPFSWESFLIGSLHSISMQFTMFSRIDSRMERSWIEKCMKNVLEHRDKLNSWAPWSNQGTINVSWKRCIYNMKWIKVYAPNHAKEQKIKMEKKNTLGCSSTHGG